MNRLEVKVVQNTSVQRWRRVSCWYSVVLFFCRSMTVVDYFFPTTIFWKQSKNRRCIEVEPVSDGFSRAAEAAPRVLSPESLSHIFWKVLDSPDSVTQGPRGGFSPGSVTRGRKASRHLRFQQVSLSSRSSRLCLRKIPQNQRVFPCLVQPSLFFTSRPLGLSWTSDALLSQRLRDQLSNVTSVCVLS